MVREVSFVICLFNLVGKVFKIETFLFVVLAISLHLCYTCWLYNKYSFLDCSEVCMVFLGSWEKGRAFYVVLWFSKPGVSQSHQSPHNCRKWHTCTNEFTADAVLAHHCSRRRMGKGTLMLRLAGAEAVMWDPHQGSCTKCLKVAIQKQYGIM